MREDQEEGSQTTRGRERPIKIISETIMKDHKINELDDKNMVFDKTLR